MLTRKWSILFRCWPLFIIILNNAGPTQKTATKMKKKNDQKKVGAWFNTRKYDNLIFYKSKKQSSRKKFFYTPTINNKPCNNDNYTWRAVEDTEKQKIPLQHTIISFFVVKIENSACAGTQWIGAREKAGQRRRNFWKMMKSSTPTILCRF